MIYYLFAVLLIIVIACVVNYGVDYYFYLKNRYCRFHIGRWKNIEIWKNAVENKADKWLKRTPTVKITDNSRYILLDYLKGNYRSNTIQSWQKAALILGLTGSENEKHRKSAHNAAENLIDDAGMWKIKPTAVDCGMLSYALMETAEDLQAIRPAMDFSLSIIKDYIGEDGLIRYTGSKAAEELYVDTLGLTCPFLAMYSEKYDKPEIEAIAFEQLRFFHTFGLLHDTALPNHAIDANTQYPLGVYGWGRGCAWYLIGLLDSEKHFQNEDRKKAVASWLKEAADSYLNFQREDGGFGSILTCKSTYDSSATAAMAWFYSEMYNSTSIEKYRQTAEKCLNKLLKCTRITGAIDHCQGDTKGIGIFAQTYDIMPFAQGMALRALNKVGK